MSEWLSLIKPPSGVPINRNHQLAQGLVASWLFNEGMGDLVHDSCGMNDGKMINMAPMSGTSGWVPGPHGAALAFDGGIDYVLPRAGFGYPRWTAVFWINPTVPINAAAPVYGQYALLQGESSGTALSMEGTRLLYGDSTLLVLFPFGDNPGWHQVVFSYDGTNLTGTVDVITRRSIAVANTLATIMQRVIGARSTGVSLCEFNGLISSVSIYNRALSAEEIAYLYAFPWCMYEDVQYRHKMSLCKYAA